MPQPVYSTRFFECAGAEASAAFLVPAGYRAVIKCASSYSDGSNAGYVRVYAHSSYFYVASYSGSQPAARSDLMHQVIYAGEQIGGYTSAAGIYLICSGFLLREALVGRFTGPPALVEPAPPPHAPDPELLAA